MAFSGELDHFINYYTDLEENSVISISACKDNTSCQPQRDLNNGIKHMLSKIA